MGDSELKKAVNIANHHGNQFLVSQHLHSYIPIFFYTLLLPVMCTTARGGSRIKVSGCA